MISSGQDRFRTCDIRLVRRADNVLGSKNPAALLLAGMVENRSDSPRIQTDGAKPSGGTSLYAGLSAEDADLLLGAKLARRADELAAQINAPGGKG
jgi:hypothetical protein